MKRERLIRKLNILLTVILYLVVIAVVLRPGFIDRHVLQELRYPDMQAIMDHMDESYRIIPVELESAAENYPWAQNENLLVSFGFANWEVGGVQLRNEGETVTLEGAATDSVWPSVAADRFRLDPGVYYVASGIKDTDVFCFLDGRNKDVSVWISEDLGEDIFIVSDPYEFWDGYSLNLHIEQGHPTETVTLTPRLVKVLDYSPAMKQEQILIWSKISRQAWDDLSEKEQDIMIRTIRDRSKECAWASIVFDDGTGIRVDREDTEEGSISVLGIVD